MPFRSIGDAVTGIVIPGVMLLLVLGIVKLVELLLWVLG